MRLPTAENPPNNIVTKDRWGKNQWETAQELLKEQGIIRFIAFQESPEGEYLPSGANDSWLETMRWFVLTPAGNVYSCILGWDDDKTAPDGTRGYYTLSTREWASKEVTTEMKNPYYIRARKELGLPLTEEQKRILKEADK